MSSNLDRFSADLDKLTSLSDEMLVDLSFQHDRATGSIQKQYEELALSSPRLPSGLRQIFSGDD
jgi:hypothetical protein